MADLFGINTTGQNDSSGISPDFWNNLMNFGLATMSASATPGITTMGALGRGGMAAMENAKNTQKLRLEQQLQQQDITAKQLNNAIQYGQAQIQNAASAQGGGPTMQLPEIPGIKTGAASMQQQSDPQRQSMGLAAPAANPDVPEATNGSGAVWSQAAGYSSPKQAQNSYPSEQQIDYNTPGLLPNNQLYGYLIDPSKQQSLTPVQRRQLVAWARTTPYANRISPEFEKSAYAGQIAGEVSQAELPARIAQERAGFISMRGAGSSPTAVFDPMSGRYVAEGAQEYVVPPGQPGAGSVIRGQPKVFNQSNQSTNLSGDMSVDQIAAALPPNAIPKTDYAPAPSASPAAVVTAAPLSNMVSMPVNVKEAMAEEGKQFVDFKNDLAERAQAGKSANAALEQMKTEAKNYQPDAWSDFIADYRAHKQALLNMLPGQAAKNAEGELNPDDKLNSYIDVNKNYGIILRETLKATYPGRITNLDMGSTGATLPGTETPMGAMILTASQLQAANDYNDAASRYFQRWRQDNPYSTDHASFVNDMNSRFTPDAFWLQHLPEGMQKDAIAKIANAPNGKTRLESLYRQRKFILANGLIPEENTTGQ